MDIVITALLALTVGLSLGWFVASSRSAAKVARLESELSAAARREQDLRASHEAYLAQVRGDHETLRQEFQALSAESLRASQDALLRTTQERLERERDAGRADLERREQSVLRLVEPMAKALDEVRRQTSEAERLRVAGNAALGEQVRQMLEASEKVSRKADDFINTLRRSDVRGNWGEVQLRRVVELAGMLPHVDFTEQEVVRDGEGRILRPDMTVRLSGGRTIVVDSKVALVALLEAFETDDERVRAERLQAHARHVRTHIDDLAGKRYWDQFDSAPEFVVMFVPSEAFYQAAVEQDPALPEYAFAKKVVIATPTTLVAMLRTAAHAWREEALAQNAHQVLTTGKELYDRLITMGTHLSKVGRSLESAGKAYNQTVASLESRVLVTARRFGEMQHLEASLESPEQVSVDARELAAPELRDASAEGASD
ncbi:DNA recombination protein RmuC [Demequina zhanjiangensis]|uniref:DNA recombination protein RmuC n=1 Tax=Demequina zhanjiangensis TaxID=3051659 RepID=A0ABT8G4J5_9MICO|nr:DNA recombination protein RmuC [Demequina sp. SYSU T00b26]MDN4474065.1 DNA recombination protein RmuC [Demequina sp. SYSU T00b26]